MFASTLFADEADVRDFDLQIQNLLRIGRADEAAAILETTLAAFGATSHPIAALCLACPVESIGIVGWDALAARIAGLDAPDAPVTALGIDISWPGHIGLEPDATGCLEPYLETNYYNDGAYPFASARRPALLEGYGPYGAEWQGGMAEIDNLLSVTGLEHLYGMVHPLVERLDKAGADEPADGDAARLGAAFIAVRLHQTVARAIADHGLPRPLAVIFGSNESYPFYDAPVVSAAESREFVRAQLAVEPVEAQAPGPEAVDAAPPADDDDRVVAISGASLRQRLGQATGPQDDAPVPAAAGGLLRRLFAR